MEALGRDRLRHRLFAEWRVPGSHSAFDLGISKRKLQPEPNLGAVPGTFTHGAADCADGALPGHSKRRRLGMVPAVKSLTHSTYAKIDRKCSTTTATITKRRRPANDRRCVVTVATGRFIPGQDRLLAALKQQPKFVANKAWRTSPAHWPSHQDKPYAFKAYALQAAAEFYDNDALLLWCDACIVPVRDMEPLWQRIERDGAVFMNNGWYNYEWTAEGVCPSLFPDHVFTGHQLRSSPRASNVLFRTRWAVSSDSM